MNQDCYIYGMSSSSASITKTENDGIKIICPKNKNCVVVHCGNDCENLKVYANNTDTLDINCMFLNDSDCKNSMITTQECDNINIYGYDWDYGDFNGSMINTNADDNLNINGAYNFDNLTIQSTNTMIEINCYKSCKYVTIITDNSSFVEPYCHDSSDSKLCQGFVVYYDEINSNRGCNMV